MVFNIMQNELNTVVLWHLSLHCYMEESEK